MICSTPQSAVSAVRQQHSKAELARLQNERFRLESLSRKDTIAWLQWVSASPGSLQDLIDRINAGDAYLEAEVLELRTEVGL